MAEVVAVAQIRTQKSISNTTAHLWIALAKMLTRFVSDLRQNRFVVTENIFVLVSHYIHIMLRLHLIVLIFVCSF